MVWYGMQSLKHGEAWMDACMRCPVVGFFWLFACFVLGEREYREVEHFTLRLPALSPSPSRVSGSLGVSLLLLQQMILKCGGVGTGLYPPESYPPPAWLRFPARKRTELMS